MNDREWDRLMAIDMLKSHNEAMDHVSQLKVEFGRLQIDPTMKVSKPGDRVVVAAGLVGKGHFWQRTECLVLEVGDTSVKVRFVGDFINPKDEMWIHPLLVTDNLGPQVETEVIDGE